MIRTLLVWCTLPLLFLSIAASPQQHPPGDEWLPLLPAPQIQPSQIDTQIRRVPPPPPHPVTAQPAFVTVLHPEYSGDNVSITRGDPPISIHIGHGSRG